MNDRVPSPHSHAWLAPIALAIVLQSFLVGMTMPVSELMSSSPLFHIDGAYHWLQMRVACELAEAGRLTGYDPYFAAGYLGGVPLNASAKVPALLAILFSAGCSSEIQVYKIFVFVAAVVGPSMVPLAARIARANLASSWIATVLGVCFWWASDTRWYHTAGMVSFVLACYVALPYCALLTRSIAEETLGWRRAVVLGIFGGFGLFLHPVFPIPVAFAALAYLAFDWRARIRLRTIGFLCAVAILSLIPNVPWIAAMAGAEGTRAGQAVYQTRIDITTIPKELIGLWGGDSKGAKINLCLLIATISAALGAALASDRQLTRLALLVWAALALFAAVGAALPGAAIVQPNRFAIASYLFLVVPASIGAQSIWLWLGNATLRQRLRGLTLAGVCSVSVAYSIVEVGREISYVPVGHYGAVPPEIRPLGEKSRWLLDWLERYTTADGRVLFETSKARVHDEAHMAGYYAITSDREFIGGPYPYMFDVSFWDGFAFGKPIESIGRDEFARDLDAYNIGWVVAHSDVSKNYLDSQASLTRMDEHDGLAVYRAERELSYFLVGTGRVQQRRVNRIVLTELEGDDIVIKYHFVAGLAAEPPATIEPVSLPGSTHSFIRVLPHGSKRVVISMP